MPRQILASQHHPVRLPDRGHTETHNALQRESHASESHAKWTIQTLPSQKTVLRF